jgi:hypothetical protein
MSGCSPTSELDEWLFVLFAFNVLAQLVIESAPNVVALCPFHYKVQYVLFTKLFPRTNGHALVKRLAAFVAGNVFESHHVTLNSLNLAGLRQASLGGLTAKSDISPPEGRIALPVLDNHASNCNWGTISYSALGS